MEDQHQDDQNVKPSLDAVEKQDGGGVDPSLVKDLSQRLKSYPAGDNKTHQEDQHQQEGLRRWVQWLASRLLERQEQQRDDEVEDLAVHESASPRIQKENRFDPTGTGF